MRARFTPQLAIGIALVAFGILLMLDRFDVVSAGRTLRLFWPTALMLIGAFMITQRHSSVGGFVLTFIGGWMLVNTLGIVRVRFWDLFWPTVIIAIGAKLITQGRRHSRRDEPSAAFGTSAPSMAPTAAPASTRGNGTVSLFSILGSASRTSADKPFRGGDMTTILGGCQLDLRQAVIPPGGEAIVDVFSLMGGQEVWVPPDWSVASEVMPVLGSVDDKRLPTVEPRPPGDSAPRIVFRGLLMMSGLTIKN